MYRPFSTRGKRKFIRIFFVGDVFPLEKIVGTESGLDGPMCAMKRRTDKREDRVEVGYQQLAEASSIAEVCREWMRDFFLV